MPLFRVEKNVHFDSKMVGLQGIEPRFPANQAGVFPLDEKPTGTAVLVDRQGVEPCPLRLKGGNATVQHLRSMAPQAGFEPAPHRLTAERATAITFGERIWLGLMDSNHH